MTFSKTKISHTRNSTLCALLVFIAGILSSCKNEIGGLKQPESVIADGGFLYVSNVNGDPAAKDSNGFISKLEPGGKIIDSKFIVGLNAPKGLCIANNIIYVADIDRVVGYDLSTKKKVLQCRLLNNKTKFLNDICFDGKETIYVTATDINDIFAINVKTKTIMPMYLSDKLHEPNGIIFENNALYVCEFGKDNAKGGLCKIDLKGDSAVVTRLADNIGYLDGLAFNDGRLYFSDWVNFNSDEKASKIRVYELASGKQVTVKTNMDMGGCADIFFDKQNGRIIAPLMNEDKLVFIPIK
jgi:hypothetical protein